MPEGPSIIILKEAVKQFDGKEIIHASGNAKIDFDQLKHQKVFFKSWGKHFLICSKNVTIRVHFLMFGSYTINSKKDKTPRLSLVFNKGELNIYTAAVKTLEAEPDEIYDWSADVMNDDWNAKKAKAKLKANPLMFACDALLDQQIFSGVGNIIKNEVLYRIELHPLSVIDKISTNKLNNLIKEARNYSFDFLKWKKAYELKKHWLAYYKKICPRCNIPFSKEYLGKTHRLTFFCSNCQELFK